MSHLEPYLLDAGANRYVLPLSINVLYQDLLNAIDSYEQELKRRFERGDMTLLNNYRGTLEALFLPDATRLTW